MTKIKRSELEKLSKEDLLVIAKEAQKIKEASKHKRIEKAGHCYSITMTRFKGIKTF